MAWSDILVGDTWATVRQKINDLGALSDGAVYSTDSPAQNVWNLGKDTTAQPVSPAVAGRTMLKVLARASIQVDKVSGGFANILDVAGFTAITISQDGNTSTERVFCQIAPGVVSDLDNAFVFASFSSWNNDNQAGAIWGEMSSTEFLRVSINWQNGNYESECDYASIVLLGFGE